MPYTPKSKREQHVNYNKKLFDGLSANKQIDDIHELAKQGSAFESQITSLEENKQDLLVSGENIKTINGETLLGSGDIIIPTLSDGDKGDVMVSANGTVWEIDPQVLSTKEDVSQYSKSFLLGGM